MVVKDAEAADKTRMESIWCFSATAQMSTIASAALAGGAAFLVLLLHLLTLRTLALQRLEDIGVLATLVTPLAFILAGIIHANLHSVAKMIFFFFFSSASDALSFHRWIVFHLRSPPLGSPMGKKDKAKERLGT